MDYKPWPFQTPEPGIYFGMPFDQYLSIECLQSSGLKTLLISDEGGQGKTIGATDFWSNSFMNPLKEENDDDTKAKIEGRAYHKRILEGAGPFYAEYAAAYEPDPTDKGILVGNKMMTEFLKGLGAKGYSGKKADELAVMVEDAAPGTRTEHSERKKHDRASAGKEMIPAKLIRQIELANKVIECHPYLGSWIKGGKAEVTVIFDHPVVINGVTHMCRFKCRFDFLKIKPFIDLKSFANVFKKNISRAIGDAFRNYAYGIQGRLYIRANEYAKKFAASGKVFYLKDHPPVDPKWLEQYSQTACEEAWYIFQQKGVSPVARGRIFGPQDKGYQIAEDQIEIASKMFWANFNMFGTDPWIDQCEPQYFDYEQYNTWGD